jgi:hypothetical protein
MNDHRWVFDPSSPSVAIDWIGAANGTYQNIKLGAPGRYAIGGYVELLGTQNSAVDFGTAVGQFGTAEFTVMLWFNTKEQQRYYDVVGNRTAPSHGNFFSLRMTGNNPGGNSGQLTAEVDQDGNGTNYAAVQSAQTGLNDGRWHHVAVVRTGPSLTLYVDGHFSASTAGKGTANIANNNPFRLGRSLSTFVSPNGYYSDLGVYTADLGSQDIYHIFCFH